MRIVVLSSVAYCLFSISSAMALECKGHVVNGYDSTKFGYKKFQSMMVTFEDCGRFIPNAFCNTVYLNGQKKTAYWAEGDFMFFDPSGTFTEKTGRLTFKMREARLNANPNEDERWFEGTCR